MNTSSDFIPKSRNLWSTAQDTESEIARSKFQMYMEKSHNINPNFQTYDKSKEDKYLWTKAVFTQTFVRMNSSRKIFQKNEQDLQKESPAKNKKLKETLQR